MSKPDNVATMTSVSPRVVRPPTTRPRRGCMSGRLHVTLEHLEDPSVDLGRRCREDAGCARLVVAEQQLEPVDGPQGAFRVARQLEPAQQLRQAWRADLDGLGRRATIEPAQALEQE